MYFSGDAFKDTWGLDEVVEETLRVRVLRMLVLRMLVFRRLISGPLEYFLHEVPARDAPSASNSQAKGVAFTKGGMGDIGHQEQDI